MEFSLDLTSGRQTELSNATLHSLADDSSVLSFESGFTDAWSVSSASRRRRLCHGVEAFEGATKGLGITQQDTNSSSTSSELARAGHTVTAGIKRKADDASTNSGKVMSEGDEKGSKSKSAERSTTECSGGSLSPKSLKASSKLQPDEYPKQDYIHVRARRGQATDSHSLAERVRREKISERMKFLQDLVPGCSKVTGKAVMLDEIINYVQSLQRQIEFLSMKLAAVDPQLDINLENLLHKELAAQARLPDPSAGYREYQQMQQLQINNRNMDLRSVGTLCDAYHRSSMNNNFTPAQLAPLLYANSLVDPSTQTSNGVVYDGDLQTIVHMGNTQASRQDYFGQGRLLHGPGFLSPGFLKVEY